MSKLLCHVLSRTSLKILPPGHYHNNGCITKQRNFMCYEVVFWISSSSQIPKIYHQKSMLLISFVFLKNKNEVDPNCSSVSRVFSAQPCNVCLYAGRILKVTPVQTSGHRACVVLGYCQLGAVYQTYCQLLHFKFLLEVFTFVVAFPMLLRRLVIQRKGMLGFN